MTQPKRLSGQKHKPHPEKPQKPSPSSKKAG
jgi:hypothetical protein